MSKGVLLVLIILIVAGAIIVGWPDPMLQEAIPICPDAALQVGPRPARYWQALDGNRVWCQLCPHDCFIPEGGRGLCRVRENREGVLYTLVYGKPVAIGIGPIEKAPFHHFHPGHRRQTIATVGCNMRCKHCHNFHISQRAVEYLEQSRSNLELDNY